MANCSKKWKRGSKIQTLMFLVVLILLKISASPVKATSDVYIVYMGEKRHEDPALTRKSHQALLSNVLGSKKAAKNSMLYSYKYGFSGFAVMLTKSHAKKISEIPGVLHVAVSRIHKLHTTRSWGFLGMQSQVQGSLLSESSMGEGTIIGVIDTGFWAESESFNDKNMGPIPSRWKGVCQLGDQFNSSNCNKKVIGARWFLKGYHRGNTTLNADYLSARDSNGHGTHTASTAAGVYVKNANSGGLAAGEARGGAPRAWLAIYKVCWEIGCDDADILKAIDMAIHDGVDILSLSIGAPNIPEWPAKEQFDGVAIGCFHATARGITCVTSAGNDGAFAQTIENTAPWLITVAATTIDRAFPASITLGNNNTFWGQSIDTGSHKLGFRDLVYAGDACNPKNLDPKLVAGKVVLCFSWSEKPNIATTAAAIFQAGGVGLIYAKTTDNILEPCSFLHCATVDYEVGTKIVSYIRQARHPVVKMNNPKTIIGRLQSPRVAYFSSRGPSAIFPAVLKPDIAAPGVNILAAYPSADGPGHKGQYAFESGTSMACPHISGIAALIRTLHPDWSPAAIKSALVTTALQTGTDGGKIISEESTRKLADPFDIGGGLVNPEKAADPGLIYDVSKEDYIHFICNSYYNKLDIILLSSNATSCLKKKNVEMDLNLPSISIPNLKGSVTVTRKVTNVGRVNSVYKAVIEPPHGVKMTVQPKTLNFNATTNKLSYKVTFSAIKKEHGVYSFGSLTWSDNDAHVVRIPIAVRIIQFQSYSDM